eukprot:PhF_6_TR43331/c0_g1_i3/m.66248
MGNRFSKFEYIGSESFAIEPLDLGEGNRPVLMPCIASTDPLQRLKFLKKFLSKFKLNGGMNLLQTVNVEWGERCALLQSKYKDMHEVDHKCIMAYCMAGTDLRGEWNIRLGLTERGSINLQRKETYQMYMFACCLKLALERVPPPHFLESPITVYNYDYTPMSGVYICRGLHLWLSYYYPQHDAGTNLNTIHEVADSTTGMFRCRCIKDWSSTFHYLFLPNTTFKFVMSNRTCDKVHFEVVPKPEKLFREKMLLAFSKHLESRILQFSQLSKSIPQNDNSLMPQTIKQSSKHVFTPESADDVATYRKALKNPVCRISVFGASNVGKSTFLNAIIGCHVFPFADRVMTVIMTELWINVPVELRPNGAVFLELDPCDETSVQRVRDQITECQQQCKATGGLLECMAIEEIPILRVAMRLTHTNRLVQQNVPVIITDRPGDDEKILADDRGAVQTLTAEVRAKQYDAMKQNALEIEDVAVVLIDGFIDPGTTQADPHLKVLRMVTSNLRSQHIPGRLLVGITKLDLCDKSRFDAWKEAIRKEMRFSMRTHPFDSVEEDILRIDAKRAYYSCNKSIFQTMKNATDKELREYWDRCCSAFANRIIEDSEESFRNSLMALNWTPAQIVMLSTCGITCRADLRDLEARITALEDTGMSLSQYRDLVNMRKGSDDDIRTFLWDSSGIDTAVDWLAKHYPRVRPACDERLCQRLRSDIDIIYHVYEMMETLKDFSAEWNRWTSDFAAVNNRLNFSGIEIKPEEKEIELIVSPTGSVLHREDPFSHSQERPCRSSSALRLLSPEYEQSFLSDWLRRFVNKNHTNRMLPELCQHPRSKLVCGAQGFRFVSYSFSIDELQFEDSETKESETKDRIKNSVVNDYVYRINKIYKELRIPRTVTNETFQTAEVCLEVAEYTSSLHTTQEARLTLKQNKQSVNFREVHLLQCLRHLGSDKGVFQILWILYEEMKLECVDAILQGCSVKGKKA